MLHVLHLTKNSKELKDFDMKGSYPTNVHVGNLIFMLEIHKRINFN